MLTRVSNGLGYNASYWYKIELLLESLDIIVAEQQHLRTIISEKEKYRRVGEAKKAKQKAKRRNANGLTEKQQEVLELKKEIIKLRAGGFSYRKIAEALKITLGKVQRALN